MTLLLPDVSEWQTEADLGGIKKMNGGAIILRAAYGLSHPDVKFAARRAQAAKLGYSFVGSYHYITAAADPVAQAHKFVQLIGTLKQHEIPMLDLEEGSGDQSARANAWLSVVDEAFGLNCLPLTGRSWLYSGLDFAQTRGLGPIFAGPRHTWVAAYGSVEPKIGHTLWQSTNGKIGLHHEVSWPGAGHCDTNQFRGSLSQLAALVAR